ncbi:DUF4864 domain-containing protein [Fluviibacterium sp. DFM31]|uniref:DUF4864 domain-containing protein n=1 Tax=Meridianimarinicoccus marinus TaxID=3231483 RepID=A0ABV3L3B9_9RHOB
MRTASLLALLTATPVMAQPAQDIETVIGDQIAAFQAEDMARAFTHAAPAIKRMFGNPESFGQMVRDGYPMVWRPADVTFLDRTEIGPEAIQRVMIRDGGGQLHFLAYRMIRLQGAWRINGVQILTEGVGL